MKVVQTFSAPMHLLMRMDEQIDGRRQKSQWICAAIEAKLSGLTDYSSQTEKQKLVRIAHDVDLPDFVRKAAKAHSVCGKECPNCP